VRYISPLRYPGGKAAIAPFLEKTILINNLVGCKYYEPYAGGAGAALELLKRDVVSAIYINDADIRIYAFWKSVLNDTDHFVDMIFSIPLNIDEWKRQKVICDNPSLYSTFEIGFSTFYMNRCNRSGILLNAGPIGGIEQNGKWKINARFNRANLAQRVIDVAKMRDKIILSNLDATLFLQQNLKDGDKNFIYLDPPYVKKADKLYMNNYTTKDHTNISKYLKEIDNLPWVLSYDDTPLVRSLYSEYTTTSLPIRYSLQAKRVSKELFIASNALYIPMAQETTKEHA